MDDRDWMKSQREKLEKLYQTKSPETLDFLSIKVDFEKLKSDWIKLRGKLRKQCEESEG